MAQAQQLLARYGVVTRGLAGAESIPGGFSAVYDVLRTLEERGRIRRGFFVSGVGATQFALPPALDLLRSLRQASEEAETVFLAASDPANPYGTVLPWPDAPAAGAAGDAGSRRTPTRAVGARVVLVDGAMAAWIGRGGRQILTWLPEAEPDRSRIGHAIAVRLAELARQGEGREGGLLVGEVDGRAAADHPLGPYLTGAGFVRSAMGYQMIRGPEPARPRAGRRADASSA